MSRARDRNVAIAIISVVAIGLAVMAVVTVLDDSGDEADEPRPTIPPADSLATVHLSEDEACDALAEKGFKRQRDRDAAEADADDLAEEYLSGDNGPARLVIVSNCDRSLVVSVGVESISSIVPAKGPRGTPVVAYFQPLIVAN